MEEMVKGVQWAVKICRPPTLQLPHQMFICRRRTTRRLPTATSRYRGATSSSDESRPESTIVRTAERQLVSSFLGRRDGEGQGRTRAQTRALNQDAAGLVSMFGPDEGVKLIHGLLAVQEVTRRPDETFR